MFENKNPLYLKIKFTGETKNCFIIKTKSQKALGSIVFGAVASLNALHAIYFA